MNYREYSEIYNKLNQQLLEIKLKANDLKAKLQQLEDNWSMDTNVLGIDAPKEIYEE